MDLWEIEEDKGWLPDLDQLRRLIRPNTKMICINNANNPTGALMDAAYLEELVTIAKEVDAYIFSDESIVVLTNLHLLLWICMKRALLSTVFQRPIPFPVFVWVGSF